MRDSSEAPRWHARPSAEPAAPPDAEPVRRLTEIEEITNLFVIHPMANRLALRLANTGIPPNAVSLTGMLCGILAGVAYYYYRDWRCACLGFVLMIAWHVMDGADGQLARLAHAQSELGRVLDGVCDYVTFAAVYLSLGIRLSADHGGWIWFVITAAGLCHAVQASAYEAQRQEYEFWGCGRDSKNILKSETVSVAATSGVQRSSRFLDRFYQTIQFAAIGSTIAFHKLLSRRLRIAADAGAFRQYYRAAFALPVRRWSILSANYRTVGIFLCTVLGAPIAYFWIEIVGFSVLLAILTYRLRPVRAAFLTNLGGPG